MSMKYSFAVIILLFSACSSNDPSLVPPVITTEEPTNITLTSATLGGSVESTQSDLISAKGVCWSKNPAPELFKLSGRTQEGGGAGTFTSELTNLSLSKYYVRAYAIMKEQIFYGNEVTLDINALVPAIATVEKETNAESSVEVETAVTYTHSAPIIEKGICWSITSENPIITSATKVIDTGADLVFKNVLTIEPWKAHYVRGYVITELGVFYGNPIQVIIIPPVNLGEVTDIDGNTYATTTIGNKVWMAENLRVTKYNDGTSITVVSSQEQFKTANEVAYIAYENDASNLDKFGYLYNGYIIISTKNVCMTGWHVPTPSDWNNLASSLGGMETAGGRMKIASNLWSSPNTAADNASGFSALPGGSYCRVCLSNSGTFADKGSDAYFWTSSSVVSFYYVTNNLATLRTKATGSFNDGMALRCVKD